MLFIVLFVLLSICSYFLYKRAKRFSSYNDWDIFCGFALIVNVIVSGCLIASIFCRLHFPGEVIEYENLKAQVEVYNTDTTHNSIEAYSLREDVLKVNNNVKKHKVYSRNPWTNVWWSKKIGDLEPIELK